MANDILIVDDEADIRMLISGVLEDEGFETRQAGNSNEALEQLRARRPQPIVLDIWRHDSPMDGIELLSAIKAEYPTVPVVMISGHGTIETAVKAIRLGAYDFIEKPFKSDRLLLIAQRAIDAARLQRENEELRTRVGADADLIGSSAAMHQLRQSVERVSPTGSRVLITGPAGVGKEVAARLIHRQSKRSDGPFVVANCANMSPERFDLELFGNEADAHAGPSTPGGSGGRVVGFLEQAHGGTLFLDEIADMPLETQGRIVRVLQDQAFLRINSDQRVHVDIRVIAASNRDLVEEIEQGRFREDLYYRLNVVPIRVPPLKERREDIPELAEHFLQQGAEASGLMRRGLSEDAMAALRAYDWPGNVRQLRNAMDWVTIMVPAEGDSVIRAEMLPPEIGSMAPAPMQSERREEIMSLPLREAREVFEREYLLAQVERFGGNISRTAAFIGMERSALHRKLKSLGVNSGDRNADRMLDRAPGPDGDQDNESLDGPPLAAHGASR